MSDLTKRLCRPGYDLQKEQAIQEAIIEIRELRARIEAMERQEPYAFAVTFPETARVELVHNLDELYEDMITESYEVRKLYLAPGALPAPSVLEGYKLVPIEPTPTMITAALESSHAINAHRAEHCYRAMLAAAPEAKP